MVYAGRLEPRRPGQESSISRAAFALGRLWLLTDAGDVSTIAPGQRQRVDVALPEPALDLCVANGMPKVLTCAREACVTWSLRSWGVGSWRTEATVPASGDGFVAMSCTDDRLTILATGQLIEVRGKDQNRVPLSQKLAAGGVTSLYPARREVFVGLNEGEFGGGLRRIDRATGRISVVERNASGERCGGPLSSKCDAVNGITPLPWKPGCLAVAVGVVHFFPHGRLVEVCGDEVRRLYFRPLASDAKHPQRQRKRDDEPYETEAFFGVVPSGKALLAVGTEGVYRFNGAGDPAIRPLPKFQEVGGVDVSFDDPDAVLVYTSINQRRSISGSVPMLMPR
jgi:hypothetical protein